MRRYCGCQRLSSHLKTTTQSRIFNQNAHPPTPAQQEAHHGKERKKKSDRIGSVLYEAKLMRPQHNHSVVVGVLSQNHQMKSYAVFKKCPGD